MGISKSEKKEIIRKIIKEMPDMYTVVYNGKRGDIEVYYYPEEMRREYLLFFNGNEIYVNSLDEVMETPFLDGKTLGEVANKVKIYKYARRLF